jgi:Cysteine protease
MRHSVHIMFGQNFAQAIQELKIYTAKYGESSFSPYFHAVHWSQSPQGDVSLSKVVMAKNRSDQFISGLGDLHSVEFETENFSSSQKEDSVIQYFDDLRASVITISNKGDYNELHLCLYIPLFEPELWNQAKSLIGWVKSLTHAVHIDLVGFDADMAGILYSEEKRDETAGNRKQRKQSAKDVITDIIKYRKEHPDNIFHFLAMQNSQTGGVSLDLDFNAFIRVIGEFSMICVEHYQTLFGVTTPESDIQSFGISALLFDKFHFVEYLLRKTYMEVMSNEGVHQENVDINLAFNKSRDLLKNKTDIFSKFFKNEVYKRIDEKIPESKIVEEVTPLLKTKLDELENECDQFVFDKKYSIPDKRAVLAALLGYDDDLFVNNIYDEQTPIFDDLESETINLFVNANNALLNSENPENAILSKSNEEPIVYPLQGIKQQRSEMQKRIGYIRQLEDEVAKLEPQSNNITESKKCLIQNGFFVLGNNEYRLLPDIIEEPLKENYVAHKVDIQSIDLREKFNNIKNQKQQGSCLSFTLTSIYEYILKCNDVTEVDLSEAFLYYNSRKKAGNEDKNTGSQLQYAIESLAESGICLEKLCKYDEKVFDKEPDEEAYADALTRRVKKALNVKRSVEDIKSALSEGYPVAISVNLYPSFGKNPLGFVSLPSEEEVAEAKPDENHRHAMVITGFNDENRFFVVRNSWGRDFGDQGYCYVPYSYIMNEKLFQWACIITEVDVYKTTAKRIKTALRFDETNTNIRLALTANLLNEERILLFNNEATYENLKRNHESLKLSLKNPNIRTKLKQYTQERLSAEKSKLQERRESTKEKKYEQLNNFSAFTNKVSIRLSLIALGILLIVFLSSYFGLWRFIAQIFEENVVDSIKWEYIGYSVLVATILVSFIFLYIPYRKKKAKQLEQEYDDHLSNYAIQIDKKDKELEETSLKMHLAGNYLSNLFTLESSIIAKYHATFSFLKNLKIWYTEENDALDNLQENTQLPFISLIKNNVLDDYYKKQKETIVQDISLCDNIISFSAKIQNEAINKDDLRLFQNRMKQRCSNKLFELISDFNLYTHLCNNDSKYEFLDQEASVNILKGLDDKSKIFWWDNNGIAPTDPQKLILIYTQTDSDTRQWEKIHTKFFTLQPITESIISPNKVVVVQLADLSAQQLW